MNSQPRNARISVLVMVPTISRPMFMPDLKRSFCFSAGFAACTSSSAEEMLMATSMTAPSALMMMPATKSPLKSMVAPTYFSCRSGSASSMRRPSIFARLCTARPKSIARNMPATVPRKALIVFRCTPPRIVKLTSAIKAQTANVVSTVGAPLKSSGIKTAKRQMIVKISPTRDLSPVLPPTRPMTRQKRIRNTARTGMRLNSYTVARCEPSSCVLTVSVTPSPGESGTP